MKNQAYNVPEVSGVRVGAIVTGAWVVGNELGCALGTNFKQKEV